MIIVFKTNDFGVFLSGLMVSNLKGVRMKLSVVVFAVLASIAMLASHEAAAKGAGGFSVARPSISRSSSPARTPSVKPAQSTQQVQIQHQSQVPSQQVTKPKAGLESGVGALLGVMLIALIGVVLMEFSTGISSANRRKI